MTEEKIDATIKELKEKFEGIKKQEFIKGQVNKSKGNSGLTFERLIGKGNDEFQIADYNGIEIKVKNNNRCSYRYLTLFSLVPSNCFGLMLKELRYKYGTPDKNYNDVNTLMKSVFANMKTTTEKGYSFKLEIKYSEKKMYLYIFNKNGILINKSIYWDFEDIISAIKRKLNYLALVKYDSKLINNQKYFKYNNINFYKFKGIDTFFELIEKGFIRIYICLGVYKSGFKAGLEHDHGIRFNIKECDLLKLYDKYDIKDKKCI